MGSADPSTATVPAEAPLEVEAWEQVDAETSDEQLLAEYGLTDDGDTGPGEGKDGAASAPAAPAAAASQAPATEKAADAGTEAPAGEPAPPTPEVKPPAEAEKPADTTPVEAYSFRADGREVKVDGAFVWEATQPDGSKAKYITAPLAEFERQLAPFRADRSVIRQERQELLTRVAKSEAAIEHHVDIVKARGVVKLLDTVLSEKDEEKRLDMLAAWEADRPIWEEQQKAAALKAQLDAVGKVQPPADEVLDRMANEEFATGLQANLRQHCEALVKQDPAKYGGANLDEILPDLWDVHDQIFFKFGEAGQLPDGTRFKAGQIGVDRQFLASRLERHATRLRNAAASAERAAKIEQQNNAVLNGSRKPPVAQKPPEKTVARVPQPEPDEDAGSAWEREYLKDVGGVHITD